MKITPIILCGGLGTRLWPLSHKNLPKQFLKLINNESCFSKTLKIVDNKNLFEPAIILANINNKYILDAEISSLDKKNINKIILEPSSKNTCPAIVASTQFLNPDSIILALPSDHYIKNSELFLQAVQNSYNMAKQNYIITFGITPSEVNTGYGYIKAKNAVTENIFTIQKFIEKPNKKSAIEYINSGYLWNSGIFMFKASKIFELAKTLTPEIYKYCTSAVKNSKTENNFITLSDDFNLCDNISIDYALMQKPEVAENILVTKIDCGWSDIGNFNELSKQSIKTSEGNNVIGDVIQSNSQNSYLHSNSGLLVALGLDNIIAYKSKNITLIAKKSESQNIKQVVEELEKTRENEFDFIGRQHRPWGFFEEIEKGLGYKIKKLIIYPKAKTSLQIHQHRAEHWVVINGVAKVTCDEKEFIITKNQSTYVPIGSKHRLENIGDEILEVIETQTGEILSENDITRLADEYGRVI